MSGDSGLNARMKRTLGVGCLVLGLVGCAERRWHGAPSSSAPFETILALASAAHPRQTEGDIVVLKGGTLLAGWSDFSGSGADHSTAEISAAISRDGGRSWSQPYTLQPNIGKQNVMSASFLRSRTSQEVLFFFLVKNSDSDLKVYVRRSSDEAQSWGAPVVVTPGPGYHIMNNARVVQLRSGRIICPVCWSEDVSRRGIPLRNLMFFSDDDGRTWTRGKGMVDCPKRGAMEPGVVELKDGRLLQDHPHTNGPSLVFLFYRWRRHLVPGCAFRDNGAGVAKHHRALARSGGAAADS